MNKKTEGNILVDNRSIDELTIEELSERIQNAQEGLAVLAQALVNKLQSSYDIDEIKRVTKTLVNQKLIKEQPYSLAQAKVLNRKVAKEDQVPTERILN